MADWADEKAEELLNDVKNHCWYDTECPDIAAALRDAREPLEKEIAALHELLGQAWALLDPQEHPDLCEVICDTLDCGTDGKPTPCTHYQQAIDRAYEEGRERGAREERRKCWSLVKEMSLPDAYSEPALDALAAEIAARGPMSQGGEE